MSNFEIVATQSGEFTLRDVQLEEKIHPSGPVFESFDVYVKQSGLDQVLKEDTHDPVILFDVGLGMATNSSAAFKTAHEIKKRKLKIISFENNLEVLRFAFKNISYFSHLQEIEKVISSLLENHFYEDDYVGWRILEGDLTNTLFDVQTKADFIFHDPYSPRKNPETWSPSIFKRYYELSNEKTVLVTYSQATHVRASLKEAGFYLGHGKGFGQKRESTVAARKVESLAQPIL